MDGIEGTIGTTLSFRKNVLDDREMMASVDVNQPDGRIPTHHTEHEVLVPCPRVGCFCRRQRFTRLDQQLLEVLT